MAAAAKVSGRLISAAWRMIKRHPLGASLIIIGLVARPVCGPVAH
jgi:hypothetical protein